MKRFVRWLFSSPPQAPSPWRVIAWWESRRIPFNLVVGTYGAGCFAAFAWALTTSGRLEPGDDLVEPIALLAAPVGVNVLYTLGWLVEVLARLLMPGLSSRFGPKLLGLGLGLGLTLISLPAVSWGGYRLLQVVGLVQ